MEESDCTVAERVEGPLRLEVVRGLPAWVQVLLAEPGPLEQEWAQPVERVLQELLAEPGLSLPIAKQLLFE